MEAFITVRQYLLPSHPRHGSRGNSRYRKCGAKERGDWRRISLSLEEPKYVQSHIDRLLDRWRCNPMNLVHCVYSSASTRTDLSPAELETLLAECRRSNSKADVTGILLYQNGSFFQVLEGKAEQVESLFHKISLDKRHHQTKKIIFEPIATRSFAEWTMGFPKITSKKLATIPGLNDFFHSGTSYVELGEGRAKSLLAAFKDGKWRASLA